MTHTIDCQAAGTSDHHECDGCLSVGDCQPATQCTEEFDAANGWQHVHYCDECADAIETEKG